MTCTTCGANMDSTATTCPACAAPAAMPAAAPAGAVSAHAAAPAGVAAASTTPPSEDEPHDDAPSSAGPGQGGYPPPSEGQHGSGGSPPSGGQQWGGPPPHHSGLPSEVRSWGIGAHLAGLGAALLTAAVFGFVGPLFVWLLKRDDHPFIDHHAKEALNFHLTVLVALLGGALLTIPAVIIGVLTLGVGLVLFAGVVLAAVVAWFVLPIIGAVRAADGKGYRYPFTIRFVR